MRKTLIAAAVIAAGAFAFYKISGSGKAGIPELDYVPADTAIFSGQFEPIDLPSYLSSLGFGPQYYANGELETALDEMIGGSEGVQSKFVLALLKDYLDILASENEFTQKSGLKEKMRSLFYMVGLSPVSRMEVADENAFFSVFDRAEQQSGFTHELKKAGDVNYRVYHFNKDEVKIDLLVTVHGGWATVVLTSDVLNNSNVDLLLALAKPEKSLNSENTLAQISSKYNLRKDSIGFISFAELARSVLTTDGNRLAKDLDVLFGEELTMNLAEWRNETCQADVASITKNWPGIYFDGEFKYGQENKVNVFSNAIIATENTNVVDALSALRGYLPKHLLDNSHVSMFHFGIGTDVGQLSSSVGKIWTELTEPTYSCAPLAEIQQNLKYGNPVAMLAMTGMANGLQGASVTVNSVKLDETMMPAELDALLTVSATNARSFIEGLAMFYPPIAEVGLPAVGEEVDLATLSPEVGMFGVDAKLVLTNDHLLIYSGETAKKQADVVAKSALSKNGLLSFGLDYSTFFTALIQSMESSGQEIPEDLAALQNTNMKLSVTVDVEKQGILTKSSMELSSKNNK